MSFKKYLAVIIAFILIAVSLVILSQSLRRPGSPGVVKKLVFEVAAPVERTINSGVGSVSGAWKRYLFLVGLEEENRELKKRIAALQGEVNDYREMSLKGSRLKRSWPSRTAPSTRRLPHGSSATKVRRPSARS